MLGILVQMSSTEHVYQPNRALSSFNSKFLTSLLSAEMSSEDQGVVCRLIPVKDENYSPEFPIDLQDGEPVVLGRNPATGIKDKRLSRHQGTCLTFINSCN